MNIDISRIKKVLRKLKQKDPALFRAVQRKIDQIAKLDYSSITHFKNLKGSFSDYKRVHISSFVLAFQVKGDTIIFRRFVHHDDAYRK